MSISQLMTLPNNYSIFANNLTVQDPTGALDATLTVDGTTFFNGNATHNGMSTYNSTINSTSSSTGSLVVGGGLGIALDTYMGGNLYVQNNITCSNIIYETQEIIESTADSTSITSGAMVCLGGAGIVKNVNIGGNANVLSTTSSTSSTTGSITTKGGMGIVGNLNVGGSISAGSFNIPTLNISATTQSTNSTTGALTISGGVGISKNLNVGGTINTNSFNTTSITTGTIIVNGGTSSTSYTSGAEVINGGLGVSGNIYNNLNIVSGGQIQCTSETITGNSYSTDTLTGALTVSGGVGIAKNAYIGGTTNVLGGLMDANTTSAIPLSDTTYNTLPYGQSSILGVLSNCVANGSNTFYGGLVPTATGANNTLMGYKVGQYLQGGTNNTIMGATACSNTNFNGNYNTGLGTNVLNSCTTAVGCLCLGYGAGYNITNQNNQFMIGNVQQSSYANEKNYSLLYGTFSGTAGSKTGQQLTINGQTSITDATASTSSSTGSLILSGGLGVALLINASNLQCNTSTYNTSLGSTLNANTGSYNTVVGGGCGGVSGNSNSFLGQGAGGSACSGSANTGFGVNTINGLTSGSYNLALGDSAGQKLTTGANNVFIGDYAGYNQTTNSNLLIVSNQNTYQSSTANEQSYSLLYGTFATSQGTTSGNTLTVNGQLTANGGIPSTSTSTGSLLVNGGIGLNGSIYMTGSIYGPNYYGSWAGNTIGAIYGGAGNVNGIMKANGSGTVSAATAGTDYAGLASNNTFTGIQTHNVADNFKAGLYHTNVSSITPAGQGSTTESIFYSRANLSTVSQTALIAITMTNETYNSGFNFTVYISDSANTATAMYNCYFCIPSGSSSITPTSPTMSLVSSTGTQTNISASMANLKYQLASSIVNLLATDNVSTSMTYGIEWRLACF